jgi:hypothetical protein
METTWLNRVKASSGESAVEGMKRPRLGMLQVD